MATEAQRLIGISLTKIAQSRASRNGVSLHKNLLVATVLQKARYVFMEEAYHMVQAASYCPSVHVPERQFQLQPQPVIQQQEYRECDERNDNLIAFTPEKVDASSLRCNEEINKDKENVVPVAYQNSTELTYLDLDKSNVFRNSTTCLKRRRDAVTEWETEEAVLSILPKKSKQVSTSQPDRIDDETEESVFDEESNAAMEIDHITSLVSVFSFGGLGISNCNGLAKLSRSVSTPDLCSAQAKDTDALQQRLFIACMTV